MRIIDLDFYADRGGAIFLGYAGEHLSTVLNFHMPAELGNNDCVYVINFRKDGESSEVVSHLAFKTGSDTNIVEYYIPSTIMGDNNSTGVFQLVAYGMTKPTDDNNVVKYSILGRSTEFHYVIDKAITTDASDLTITLNSDEEITIKGLIKALEDIRNIEAALGNLDGLINTLNNFINKSNDLSNKISTNTTNISNLSTKVGSYSFDNLTKINGVIPSNLMDALRKISTALNSLDNNKINKADAIKYTNESVLNDCVEPGTIYRYKETVNGNENGLAIGVYTVIPSHIAEDGKLAQYIFSTTGAIYYRYRTVKNGSYVYTTKQLVTRQEFSALNDIVSSMYNNKTTVINETTLAENNRNKLYPTTGAVDDYIKALSEKLSDIESETKDNTTAINSLVDPTLSVQGKAAEAKAVGDALALKANAQDVNTALTKKVDIADMVPYLHYVVAESSAPEEGTTYSLADRTPNSYSYINSDWYGDKPSNLTGAAWIFTITPRSTSSYGMQFCLKPQNNSLYIRTKTKQSNVYVWSNWSTFSDASLSVEGAFADAKAVGDALAQKVNIANMVPYLHYVDVSAPAEGTTYSLGDLTSNSYSYVVPSWFPEEECPQTAASVVWVFTIIPKSNSSYGMQFWFEPANNILHIRKKTKQQDGSYAWGAWTSVSDTSLSVEGAFADAKAVGDALAQKLSPNDSRLLPYLHHVKVSATSASSDYGSLLTNLTPNSYSWVSSTWFSDAPTNGNAWVFSIVPTSTSSFGMQIWFEPSTNILYKRRKSTSGWNDWIRLDDAYKQNSIYFAFGDSTTKGQIGRWTGGTSYSTRGYPDTTAAMLHMTLNNQAVGGQGLIKDWALIVDTINALDMSNAGLITVGWAYNDAATYRTQGLAMGSYTDVTSVDVTDSAALKALVTYDTTDPTVPVGFGTTVIGYYYTIMKLLQTKCPSAQIVLVTGYGNGNGDRNTQKKADLTNQFTRIYTFGTGSNHTVKELYDELEKMANLHGWCCVNQSKGCAFNEFNAAFAFGDHIHPNDDGYAMYGNNLAPRIAAFYGNRKLVTDDL